jgi:hypothetical protein
MIYRNKWEIDVSEHVYRRADQRNITADMIEATIRNGRIEKFGKNMLKFISRYKRGEVVCIGEKKAENKIKIITIECRSL